MPSLRLQGLDARSTFELAMLTEYLFAFPHALWLCALLHNTQLVPDGAHRLGQGAAPYLTLAQLSGLPVLDIGEAHAAPPIASAAEPHCPPMH